ncbi:MULTISPECIES: nuclear transport factor 2 family protein [unclassified Mycobacterium]|uniref:nuclear transport factor 2 family protein n=1 Tax=unclassified Mycobacterium TaxID=2642494 RepID=UPI0029C6212A|nr:MULTISPECIES: nuclear transport factor 2 family protein [unclassified Mycobacterium]
MTPPVIERWHAFLEGGHGPDALDELLADDAVFYSPAVFTPQEGKAKTATYLGAAAKLFGGTDFHYVGQWFSEQSAVLEFAATIDGMYVNGIDMIAWNDADRITSFKVMIRPFKGLQLVMGKMAELLQPT